MVGAGPGEAPLPSAGPEAACGGPGGSVLVPRSAPSWQPARGHRGLAGGSGLRGAGSGEVMVKDGVGTKNPIAAPQMDHFLLVS